MDQRDVLIVQKIIIVIPEAAHLLGIIVLPEVSGMIVPTAQILAKTVPDGTLVLLILADMGQYLIHVWKPVLVEENVPRMIPVGGILHSLLMQPIVDINLYIDNSVAIDTGVLSIGGGDVRLVIIYGNVMMSKSVRVIHVGKERKQELLRAFGQAEAVLAVLRLQLVR